MTEVTFFNGMASGPLVARSTQVKRYSNPPLALGNGPTISTATTSAGTSLISLLVMGFGFGLVFDAFWHYRAGLAMALDVLPHVGPIEVPFYVSSALLRPPMAKLLVSESNAFRPLRFTQTELSGVATQIIKLVFE